MGSFSTKIDPTLRLLPENRTDKSIEKHEKEEQWRDLPSPVLERIYSLASRVDQFNMSLVCRKWSEEFHSPAVCQEFRFSLTESQLSTDKCSMMIFVQKCSCMFRHVVIEYSFPSEKHLIKTWCRRLIVFLQILANNSQLISVDFRYLIYCFEDTDTATYGDICRAIADFLGSQNRLKRVEFNGCSFRIQECAELLKKLTENSRESLTHLVLREFFPPESNGVQDSTAAQNIPTLECLPSLTTLKVDYSWGFENMVARQSTGTQTVKNCQTLALSKIILRHYDDSKNMEDLRGLTSADWRSMRRLCPDLQVELIIISSSQRDVEFFIVPNMPITRLKYTLENSEPYNRGMIVEDFFSRLLVCKINDYLVSLSLESDLPIFDSASFIPFLQACKKLKNLKLSVVYGTSIAFLMESWLDNRPESLEEVSIEMFDIEDGYDDTNMMNITKEFVSLLELAGLKVKVNL